MSFKQAFILAFKSMANSKMRAFLTMLGIIIGVASVIILVSLIEGLKSDMVKRFESMGTNLITVNVMGRGGNRTVTPEGMMELVEKNSDSIGSVTPMVTASGMTVKYQNENITTTCIGSNEFYPSIRSIEVESGRYLEYVDIDRRQKNCVVGSYIVEKIFSGASPLGREIKINGDTFTIVGTIKSKANNTEGGDDDRIYLPYSIATTLSRNRSIGQYAFSAKDKDTTTEAMNKITQYMFSVYNDDSAYRVSNMADALESVNEITAQLSVFLVGVAGISLLVGGIGIMNIMLVSVTERTREIGIRKSLGAKPWDIMSQFVVEAATTSSIGGFLGIALGIGAAILAGKLMNLPVVPSISSIAVAFSVSVGIGMIFGYSPAKKASKLNPIDALRYD